MPGQLGRSLDAGQLGRSLDEGMAIRRPLKFQAGAGGNFMIPQDPV
jgi:hypothetical protein